jgi:hypothetical protein
MPMNVSMVDTHDDQRFLYEEEVTSPELVLVDPDLAQRARARLRNPAEKEALARIASQLERAPEPATPVETGVLAERRRRWPGRWAAPVAAALAVAFLLADALVEFGKTPASADTAALEAPEPTAPEPTVAEPTATATAPAPTDRAPSAPNTREPKSQPSRAPSPSPSAGTSNRAPTPTPARVRAEPQRFAWAPVTDASGYHVELFRQQVKVFAADTRQPAVTIPVRWRFADRKRRLAPGEYRWYVWPVVAGRRAARAIVQSRLTVPSR